MTMVSLGGHQYIPHPDASRSTTAIGMRGDMVLDTSDERGAVIVRMTRAGTIKKVGYLVGATAGTPDVYLELQGVVATSGLPDGTIIAAGASSTEVNPTANTWKWTALTTPLTVTQGQMVAFVFSLSSFAGGDSATLGVTTSRKANTTGVPYGAVYPTGGGPWAKGIGGLSYPPNLGIIWSDDLCYHIPELTAWSSVVSQSIDNATNPDRIGNRFKVNFKCRITGFWQYTSHSGDYDLIFYDTDGTTIIETISPAFDKDNNGSTTDVRAHMLATPYTPVVGSYYRFVHAPSSTTNNNVTSITVVDDGSTVAMGSEPYGINFHHTQCNGVPTAEGDWVNTLTQRCLGGLIIDQLDDGAGAGGGLLTHPGMSGGMRG